MSRFIEGHDRSQGTLFPEQLEDWIADDNPVRAVDAFVEALDLRRLGLTVQTQPALAVRPTIPQRSSRSMSTVTLTAFSQADGSSARHNATSSSSGLPGD